MPRKKFLEDIGAAIRGSIDGVTAFRKGDDDGSVKFTVACSGMPDKHLQVVAMISESSDYPNDHFFVLYAESDDKIPASVADNLENLSATLAGFSVQDMLRKISSTFMHLDGDEGPSRYDASDSSTGEEEYDDSVYFQPNGVTRAAISTARLHRKQMSPEMRAMRNRIRQDLLTTKAAGFRVAVYNEITSGGYICLSCRIAKLGISEEAMKAWHVHQDQYFMLVLGYKTGYTTFEDICSSKTADTSVLSRLVVSDTYKPTLNQVTAKINSVLGDDAKEAPTKATVSKANHGLKDVFISSSLNELMNGRFFGILRARVRLNTGWTKAETYISEGQGRINCSSQEALDKVDDVPSDNQNAFPGLVTADHLAEDPKQPAMPLCMMQFALRHFVRCTEFCLNCHCFINASFEALKPYVCSKPLCLYQYMNLGFGQSIEWEIFSQPYVVDLLISFCYTAAIGNRLKDFPVGLGMDVPGSVGIVAGATIVKASDHNASTASEDVNVSQDTQEFKCRLDIEKRVLFSCESKAKSQCPLRPNQWVMLTSLSNPIHARVHDISTWPSVQLSELVLPVGFSTGQTQMLDVTCYPYCQAFDDLNDAQKQQAITNLLSSLPDVMKMKNYLQRGGKSSLQSLSHWKTRISPAALNLLRWIIASNRSCIVQVDSLEGLQDLGDDVKDTKQLKIGSTSGADRVPGMKDWVQFRFAQGAPDKEQRFMDAVKSTQGRLNLSYPTIFAWHGSPLSNWHGIIREGLHFKDTLHGRAFGHGVYLSQNFSTSSNYMSGGGIGWPRSKLRISSAIALNEVVNAPREFISRTPHLVVSQLDWIQTRYLFVRGATILDFSTKELGRDEIFEQDPSMTVLGQNGKLQIPISVLSKSRRPVATNGYDKIGCKRRRTTSPDANEDDSQSVDTTQSDRDFLDDDSESSDDEILGSFPVRSSHVIDKTGPHTQFIVTKFDPGRLEIARLPKLPSPQDGSTMATKRLQQEMQAIVREQKKRPIQELGWYMDPEHTANMYQWVMHMHSIDLNLPLAMDMQRANIQAIVLEIRFTANYPYVPPFIRVVQPRFLDFALGGGGHVTAGGAICMELLTNSGWNPASSLESILLQVRMAITSTEPRPARLSTGTGMGYQPGEAFEAYKRACRVHGWEYPKEFDDLAQNSQLVTEPPFSQTLGQLQAKQSPPQTPVNL